MAGPVAPGDANMARGGASEGANQVNQSVLILKEPLTGDRNLVIKREPYLTYFVLRDGELENDGKYRRIRKDMAVKDYDKRGFFKRVNRLSFLGINPNPVSVAVGVTIRLSDMTELPGVIMIDVVCNEDAPEALVSMLSSDYAQKRVMGNIREFLINAEGLSRLLKNPIQDNALQNLIHFDSTTRFIADIRKMIFDSVDIDPAFSSKGLYIHRASIRFEMALVERVEQLRTVAQSEIQRDLIRHEQNMLRFELAGREYDAVNGGA